jgi:uncharacterized protein YkvS
VCSIEFHGVIPSYVDLLNENSVNIDNTPLESFDLDGMVVVSMLSASMVWRVMHGKWRSNFGFPR